MPLDRKKGLFQWIDYLVLISFLVLIRLPAAFGLQYDIRARLLVLVPIIFVTWRRLFIFLMARKPMILVAQKSSLLYIIYILILTIAFTRTILNESVETSRALGNLFLLVLSQAFIFALASQTEKPGEDLKKGIYLTWLVYIGVNLLMEAGNLAARNEIFTTPQISTLGSYVGLQVYRTTFPTATGVNTFGNVAAALLIGSFLVVRERRSVGIPRIVGIFGIITSLITMVFTDSRAAIIFAFVTIACAYIPYPTSRLFRFLPLTSVILPILILGVLNALPPTTIQMISRNQMDALTLSNRTVIWSAGLETLRESPSQVFFGYGYRGQIISGAVEKYQYLFGAFNEITSLSLHNSYLQLVFESGIVGVILLVLILTILFHMLDHERRLSNSMWTNILYFTLIYFTLISSTDSVLTFDNQESYITFLFIATVSFFSLAKQKS